VGVAGFNCVENSLWVGGNCVCGGGADGGEVRSVFGTRFKSRGCCFVVVVSVRALPVDGILFFSDRFHEFPVSFSYDECDLFMIEGGDVL